MTLLELLEVLAKRRVVLSEWNGRLNLWPDEALKDLRDALRAHEAALTGLAKAMGMGVVNAGKLLAIYRAALNDLARLCKDDAARATPGID